MQIGSPLFEKVVIHLNPEYYAGETFTLVAHDNTSEETCYVQKAVFNGKKQDCCFISLKEIQKGGKLELWMGEEPNELWGISKCPPSMSTDDSNNINE